MYKQNKMSSTTLKINNGYEGETIEHKINRIVNNKEPIKDGAPITYTERREGVLPQYDVRADKWEIAIDAMEKVTETHRTNRELSIGERTYDTMTAEQQKAFNEKFPKNKHAKAQTQQSNPGTGPNTSDSSK